MQAGDAFARPVLPAVGEALALRTGVVEAMDVPVRRLLPDKAAQQRLELMGQRPMGLPSSGAAPRTESMKNCSPTGKLIDSALKNCVRKASPPCQWRAKPCCRSTSSLRTGRAVAPVCGASAVEEGVTGIAAAFQKTTGRPSCRAPVSEHYSVLRLLRYSPNAQVLNARLVGLRPGGWPL